MFEYRIPGTSASNQLRGGLRNLIVCGLLALAVTSPLRSELVDPAPVAEQKLNWKMGDMKADPLRNLVYILNNTDNRLLALDTNTGKTVRSVPVPEAVESGKIGFSVDGGIVYVSTPYANGLHSYTAGDLSYLASVSLDHSIHEFVIGSDGCLYAPGYSTGTNQLLKVEVSTGSTLGVLNTLREINYGVAVRDSAGNRLFFMQEGYSGDVEEFAVNPGGLPVFTATRSMGVSNARDMTFDEASNTLYATGGGISGINRYNITTMVSTFWPYGSNYGSSVAQISGNSDVFGASGSGRIRRFRKSTGLTLHDYAYSGGSLVSGDLITGNLEVTPNGRVVFGKEASIGDGDHYIGLIGNASISLPDSVSIPDPRAHKEVLTTWDIGDTLGDPSRNLVYIVDVTNAKLIAFNTVTGQASADVSIPASPANGKLGLSPDGTVLFFTTPATAQLHRFNATNTLSYLGATALPFAASHFAIGSDGRLYSTKSGDLQKVNVSTGATEGQITNPDFYGTPLIRRNGDGSRLFVMELGLSGGTHSVDEFAIVDGAVPAHVGTAYDDGMASDVDLSFDDSRDTFYRASGGKYGISVWRNGNGIENYWPFDSPYGRGVAQIPGAPTVFGASGTEHIREFDKDSARVVRTFDHSDAYGGFLPGDILPNSIEVAVNNVAVYGKSNYSSGTFCLGVIGLENFSFPRSAPTRPTNVSATDGTFPNLVSITWSSVTGATSYEVYRRNDDTKPFPSDLPVATVGTTSWSDPSASASVIHRYWIKAVNAYGKSTFSDKDYGSRIVPAAPAAPVSVFAGDGTDSERVVVSWSPVSQATGYQVFRSTASSPASATRVADAIPSPFWADTSAALGVDYYYWVKAVNAGGTSGFSSFNIGFLGDPPPSTLPTVPGGVSATQGSLSNGIQVSWDASLRAKTYRVFRGSSDVFSTSVEVVNGVTGTSWLDPEVTPWVTYFYWVEARNDDGGSGIGNSASGFAKGIPGTPMSVTASDGTSTSWIRVAWNPVAGAETYRVYRNTSAVESTSVEVASDIAGSSWNDTNATFGIHYYYWVKAENGEGAGNLSAPDVGYLQNPITPPTTVAATDGIYGDRVEVSWNAGTYADSYRVFRGTTNNPALAQELASGLVNRFWSDTGVIPGVSYHYWIRSTNGSGDSSFGGSDIGYAKVVPVVPTGLAATDGSLLDRVRLTWVPSASANEYHIYRALAPNGPYGFQGSFSSGVTSFSDFQAISGQVYYYYVRSWSTMGGLSDPSVAESGYRGIGRPGSVVASDGLFQGEVRLEWTLVTGATHYEIFRGISPDGSDAIQVGDSVTGSFVDTEAVGGEGYHYFVKAIAGAASSALSDGDAGLATSGLPFRPDGLIGIGSRATIGGNAYFPTPQQVQSVSKRSQTVFWSFNFENDGETTDEITTTITKGNRYFDLNVISPEGYNVTSLAYLGRLTSSLPSREVESFRLECKPTRSTRGKVKQMRFAITGQSGRDDQLWDVLHATVVTSKK